MLVGLVYMLVTVTIAVILLLPLLPWRIRRIHFTNFYGTVLGSGILRISGCKVSVSGQEHVHASKPAIYAGNHTSIFDAFTSIWLSPTGTVGVAKKEILYYPFYGLTWVLAGHLLVDRGRTDTAKAGLRKMGDFVRKSGLHIFMWPEGTRARDGRLLPFKKGVVHLALQTGLPIVPMVTVGAHKAWIKGSMLLRKVPIEIKFLPPVDTSHWKEETLDEHVQELYQLFVEALPEDMRPTESDASLAVA